MKCPAPIVRRIPSPTGSKSEWGEGLLEQLDEAVRLRLMADVPLGAMLSGGLDSSLIVALMARHSTQPVKTFSIGFTDAGRVYVDGKSPGGWHTASGGGLWIGLLNPGTNFNILFTNNKERRVTTSIGFAY